MNQTMTPVDWAKRPIVEKYADFTGRAPRAEYWWYFLGIIVVAVVLSIIEGIFGVKGMILGLYGPLTALFGLATIVPGIAVGVRRLHDTNRSGWWMLIAVIPYALLVVVEIMTAGAGVLAMLAGAGLVGLLALIGAVILLVLMVLPSQPGTNQYGPNPYGEGGTGPVPAE